MRYHTKRFLLLASLLVVFTALWAQDEKADEKPNQLTIDAQLMSRGEVRRGGLDHRRTVDVAWGSKTGRLAQFHGRER